MPRRMNQTQRFRRIEAIKAKAEVDIAAAINRVLKDGWHRLFPIIQGFKKADVAHDEKMFWESFDRDFQEAIIASLTSSAEDLAAVEREWAISNGHNPGADPGAIVRDVIIQLGSEIRGIDLTGTTHDNVDAIIKDWFTTDETMEDLTNRLAPWFSPERAQLIGITETTRLASTITEDTMKAAGLSQWKWADREDGLVCPECSELGSPENVYGMDDLMPPAHPGCRCGVIMIEADEAQPQEE